MKSCILVLTVLAALTFTGCGGTSISSSTTPPATTTTSFTIGGTVTGLTGTVVLQDNGTDNLSINANGPFTFSSSVASGSAYSVTVLTQPANQTCSVSNGSGTATASVNNIAVTCTTNGSTSFTLSVMVTGLSGGTLVVEDSQNDQLTFTTNNTQTFATPYPSGATYSVSGVSQPTGEACSPGSNSTGTITSNTTVTVTCIPTGATFTLSVMVTGLSGGSLVVQDNLNDQLTFTTNNTQQFATQYASGQPYSVIGVSQPTGQACSLSSNSSGNITANTTVTATCVPSSGTVTISAQVTGLNSGASLVIEDSATDKLTFTANSTPQMFATQYVVGQSYNVTIVTQPVGQTCTPSNYTGTITSNLQLTFTCTASTPTDNISVAVTGLTGTLVMQDSNNDTLTFTTNDTQTFASSYASGSSYTVSVKTPPSGQACTLSSNASGTITSNITVTATCTTSVVNYNISVAVTGLTGTLVVQDNVGPTLNFTTNTTQTFSNAYASGSSYTVSVKTPPSGQTCTLGSNASGTITSNITVTATCTASGSGPTISVAVSGLTGTVVFQDDQGETLTFTSNETQTFSNTYASGAAYTVSVTSQPVTESCIPTYSTGTMGASGVTIFASCGTGVNRALGKVSDVSDITCQGSIKNGVCQQMTVSCPGVPDIEAYVKTNTPTGTPLGVASYGTGTDGNGLYDDIFTYGSTAVGNVLDAGFITVQISWGTPFNSDQPNGWVQGPGGVLAAACHYATVVQWIHDNIGTSTPNLPYCATGNSGGAGAVAYTLSQYPNQLAMAEVTSGPPPGRLDWGCGCTEGTKTVQCGSSTTLGTCFGKTDGAVWDGAYSPNALCSTAASGGALPPGGLNFLLGDSVEAPGANYDFPSTFVNLVFGGADSSSAIPIGQDWFDNITSSKAQACVAGGMHSLADTLPGAQQIANDLISLCKAQ